MPFVLFEAISFTIPLTTVWVDSVSHVLLYAVILVETYHGRILTILQLVSYFWTFSNNLFWKAFVAPYKLINGNVYIAAIDAMFTNSFRWVEGFLRNDLNRAVGAIILTFNNVYISSYVCLLNSSNLVTPAQLITIWILYF